MLASALLSPVATPAGPLPSPLVGLALLSSLSALAPVVSGRSPGAAVVASSAGRVAATADASPAPSPQARKVGWAVTTRRAIAERTLKKSRMRSSFSFRGVRATHRTAEAETQSRPDAQKFTSSARKLRL